MKSAATGRSGKRAVGSSDLDAALGPVERVLLDTSALIAFHSPQEQVHPLADYVLRRIESDADPLRGYYSAVSASEILIRPLRTSLADFTGMQSFLTNYPHLTVLPADLTVAAQAANVRAFPPPTPSPRRRPTSGPSAVFPPPTRLSSRRVSSPAARLS